MENNINLLTLPLRCAFTNPTNATKIRTLCISSHWMHRKATNRQGDKLIPENTRTRCTRRIHETHVELMFSRLAFLARNYDDNNRLSLTYIFLRLYISNRDFIVY